MRHLVTGGAGFIGSHLAQRLVDRGDRVVVVDDLSGGTTKDQLARWWSGYDIDLWDFPVADLRATDGRFDVVWHLASPVGPVGVLGVAGYISSSIVADADLVAELANAWDAPLIFTGTSEVYGPQPGAASDTSNAIFTPVWSARQEYAAGKLAAEVMLLNRRRLDVRVVRPFNVAGPRQRPGGGFVIPRWIEQWQAGEPITVYGDGQQRRSFTHVADFTDGIIRVWSRGERGRYNLGSPANLCTLLDLAHLFVAVTGAHIRFVDPVDLHGPGFREAADKWAAPGRAIDDLGWAPSRTLAKIIADALDDMA